MAPRSPEPTNPKIIVSVWTGLSRPKTSHGTFLYRPKSGATIHEARKSPAQAASANQQADDRKKPRAVSYALSSRSRAMMILLYRWHPSQQSSSAPSFLWHVMQNPISKLTRPSLSISLTSPWQREQPSPARAMWGCDGKRQTPGPRTPGPRGRVSSHRSRPSLSGSQDGPV